MQCVPKVSVIIPVYNVEMYLDRCMQSVLNQSYPHLEIILINDGSTDSSGEKCLGYAKENDRIIYLCCHNRGLGEARNLGIRSSSCEYITFVDSDDWLELDFVQKVLAKMIEHNADLGVADVYYVDGYTMDKSISKVRLPSDKISSVKIDKSVINKTRTFPWAKIFKKTLFTNNNIWFHSIPFEDIACLPILTALSEKIIRINMPLYNYLRNRTGSLSGNHNSIKGMESAIRLLENKLKELDLNPSLMIEFKKILIGAVRVVWRKWGYSNDYEAKVLLNNVAQLLDEYFPGLRDRVFSKFYPVNDDINLKMAIDCIVPNLKQLVATYETADILISFELLESDGKRVICVEPPNVEEDSEAIIWEIAEKIMERM